jgi:hypothetical protein
MMKNDVTLFIVNAHMVTRLNGNSRAAARQSG